MKKRSRLFLVLLLCMVLPQMVLANLLTTKGEMDESQSFKTSFKHFKKVKFVSFVDSSSGPSKLHLYLLRDGDIVTVLPEFQTEVSSWSYEAMSAISFKDIDKDGLKDIIVMAYYVTGIGPTGMRPFLVKDIYFQTKEGFVKKKKVSKLLNDSKHYQKLKSIKNIVSFLQKRDN